MNRYYIVPATTRNQKKMTLIQMPISPKLQAYFKEHMPKYEIVEVVKKSSHPDDSHLYMVAARKHPNTFAVWTSWNESTESLNHGHYGLTTLLECEKIFQEFYHDAGI